MVAMPQAIESKDGQTLLFESSRKSIPFTLLTAVIFGVYLIINGLPVRIGVPWIILMVVVNAIRIVQCYIALKVLGSNLPIKIHIRFFMFTSAIVGFAWGSVYFITLPYLAEEFRYVGLLIMASFGAAATVNLSVYIPAFYGYVLPIFIPVISYNIFSLQLNRMLLSILYTTYMVAIVLVARANQRILQQLFYLTEQNKALISKLEKLSLTDSLTSLYNRRSFSQQLKNELHRSHRNNTPLVIISIDVDNFKMINDTFGHPFGDEFLIYTAQFLKYYFKRAGETIFRMGGDEFVVIMANAGKEEALVLCKQIQESFLKDPPFEPVQESEKTREVFANISLSMGVVYISPHTNYSIELVVEKVDQLLYQAKEEGKGLIKDAEVS